VSQPGEHTNRPTGRQRDICLAAATLIGRRAFRGSSSHEALQPRAGDVTAHPGRLGRAATPAKIRPGRHRFSRRGIRSSVVVRTLISAVIEVCTVFFKPTNKSNMFGWAEHTFFVGCLCAVG